MIHCKQCFRTFTSYEPNFYRNVSHSSGYENKCKECKRMDSMRKSTRKFVNLDKIPNISTRIADRHMEISKSMQEKLSYKQDIYVIDYFYNETIGDICN